MHTSSSFQTFNIIYIVNVLDIDGLGHGDSIGSSFDFIHKIKSKLHGMHFTPWSAIIYLFYFRKSQFIKYWVLQTKSYQTGIWFFHPIFKAFLLFTLIYLLDIFCEHEPFLRVSEKKISISPALKCPLRKTTSIPYIFPSLKLSKPVKVEICLSLNNVVLVIAILQIWWSAIGIFKRVGVKVCDGHAGVTIDIFWTLSCSIIFKAVDKWKR